MHWVSKEKQCRTAKWMKEIEWGGNFQKIEVERMRPRRGLNTKLFSSYLIIRPYLVIGTILYKRTV